MKQQEVLSSVYNALRILKEFSPDNKELGISELSKRLGLAKSTVFRLMKTLKEADLVHQNERTKKYQLGMSAFELGFTVYHSTEVRQVAIPFLEKLMTSIRKVIRLGVYNQSGVLYLCKRPKEDQATQSKIGNSVPAHCTAIGKVLLAHQGDDEVQRVLDNGLKKFTNKTVTSPDKLKKQLQQIQEQGYAVTREELRSGFCSVAVPIYNSENVVIAAISATGSTKQFYPSQINNYVKTMNMTSRLITENLNEIDAYW